MNAAKTKEAIKKLLMLHQEILLAGGTYAFSPQYRQFIIQKKMVLQLFSLPETDKNIRALFDFPLSQTYDIAEPINDKMCRFKAMRIIRSFNKDEMAAKRRSRKQGRAWSIEDQAEYVYDNMVRRAEEHLNS